MDNQQLFNVLFAIVGVLGGWWMKAMWEAVKALLNARPVFYRSKCAADPKDWSYWGFIAEELAEIDPRLVRWGHAMKAVEQPNGLPPKMVEDKDSPLVPIGVQYSRLVVPLLQVVKRQSAAIEALTARLYKLEGKV